MRDKACSSIIGFHCGSSKYAREAAVRSRLFDCKCVMVEVAKKGKEMEDGAYPVPPQVMETRMTWTDSSVWNF